MASSHTENTASRKLHPIHRNPILDTALETKDRIQLTECLLSIREYTEDPYYYVNLVMAHACLMEEGYLSIVLFSLVNKETALAP